MARPCLALLRNLDDTIKGARNFDGVSYHRGQIIGFALFFYGSRGRTDVLSHIYNPSKPPFKCTSFLFVATVRQNKRVCSALTLIATLIREACGKTLSCIALQIYCKQNVVGACLPINSYLCNILDIKSSIQVG